MPRELTSERSGERTLPQNLEAERSVLGAILLDNHAFNHAAEILTARDFYSERHRAIYDAMASLSDKDAPIDPVTLREELDRRDDLERAGGAGALASLVEGLPRATNVGHYARIVKDKAALRNLIASANEIIDQALDGEEDADDIIDQAERRIFEIGEDKVARGFVSTHDLADDTMQEIEELAEGREHVTGVPTGFKRLDTMTAGLQPGDLVILAGRPSMGKTALALNIAQHVGLRRGGSVGVFSLEMADRQLIRRMITAEARVDAHKLASGYLSETDINKLMNCLQELSNADIFIDDSAAITPMEMRAKTRRLKAEHGLDLVVVDYLQLVRGGGRFENRNLEIGAISRALKAMAKELKVPVLALSQLSRAPEARAEHRPQLSDLRECVTGDTLVHLADGRRVPISRLVGETPEVVAMSPEGKMITARTKKIWSVGTREVFAVRLASGRAVRTTAKHRLYGTAGWTRVGELSPGDRLAIPRRLPEPQATSEWPELRVALLGQLIGDGSYLKGQPLRYTTSSESNSEIVKKAATTEFGTEVKRYDGGSNWHQLLISGNGNRWHPAGVNKWLRDLGIFDQRSFEKRIPEAAFRLSNRQIGLLLQHLWATDGCIAPKPKGGDAVHLATSSPGLATDVADLLLRLGIVSRTYEARKSGYRPSFLVSVRGAAAQRKFLDRVGAFGPKIAQARRLERKLEAVEANTNVDTLPVETFDRVRALMQQRGITTRAMAAMRGTSYGGSSHFRFAPSRQTLGEYAEILEDDELRGMATNDLFWDRVVAVEPDGEEEVFDLTVPGPASWVADSMISHNSGNLEQDADVVAFIFREEVYQPQDPELQGLAEVILAKQRNGPIGRIKLAFLKEYTRFENLQEDWE